MDSWTRILREPLLNLCPCFYTPCSLPLCPVLPSPSLPALSPGISQGRPQVVSDTVWRRLAVLLCSVRSHQLSVGSVRSLDTVTARRSQGQSSAHASAPCELRPGCNSDRPQAAEAVVNLPAHCVNYPLLFYSHIVDYVWEK